MSKVTTIFAVGDKVVLFGKTVATVTSVHKGGKRLGVLKDGGVATFVTGCNAKLAVA